MTDLRYPTKINQIIIEIGKRLGAINNAESVLLVGSASRGELKFVEKQSSKDNWILLSDLEFIVISNSHLTSERINELDNSILAVTGSQNALTFHVDYSIIPAWKLSRLPKKLFVFEAKETGLNVYGEDCRGLLPEVTIIDIWLEEVNDILIWRLTDVLMSIYAISVSGNKNNDTSSLLNYILTKNMLDLLTWVLIRNQMLIPGHNNRLEKLEILSGQFGKEFCMRGIKWGQLRELYEPVCRFRKSCEEVDNGLLLENFKIIFNSILLELDFPTETLSWGGSVKFLSSFTEGTVKGFIKKLFRCSFATGDFIKHPLRYWCNSGFIITEGKSILDSIKLRKNENCSEFMCEIDENLSRLESYIDQLTKFNDVFIKKKNDLGI